MENKERINLYYKLLISIAVLIPALIGISYAFFLANIKGNSTNMEGTVVSNFDFNLVTENDGYISATNVVPIPDSDVDTYASVGTFKVVTGNNKYPVNYSISLTDITITDGLKNADFRWKLLRNNIDLATGSFDNYTSGDLTLKTDVLIGPNTTDDFKILIYIKETTADQSGVLNQSFNGKVKITGEFDPDADPFSDYQEVEYIASSGTQYIYTGYKPGPNTGVEVTYQFTDLTVQQRVFGVQGLDSVSASFTYVFYINGSSKWAYGFKNGTGNWISTNVAVNTNNHLLKFNVNNGYFSLDNGTNTAIKSSTRTKTALAPMTIFANTNEVGNVVNRSKLKIYDFKIYENGNLVKAFVPCYRKNDNTAGLYDLVNDEFYANAGTGDFVVGPNVN